MTQFLDDPILQLLTKTTLRDRFSYTNRTEKRLLRRVLLLASEVSNSERVQNDALTVEVWFACIAPVAQGYWQSSAHEDRKKKVLDAFYPTMLNIVFNDVCLPASQELSKPGVIDIFFSTTINEWGKLIRKRVPEYGDAMEAFFQRGKGPNIMPTELIEALIHNLFDGPDSAKKPSAESAESNPELFMEVMMMVALPMISTFAECLAG